MEKTKETIVEEREERMVSLTGNEKPKLRTAHFLKPSVTSSIGENTPKHPSHPNYFLPSTFEPKNIAFHGWRSPQKKWKEWVDKMVALHESTWKKAGIYEAVLSSVYQIRRNNDLLLGLAEKWCSETNTFIFPWGEATITLEDMLVAGYSVLGSPVFSPLETEELKGVERKLMEIRKELGRSKAKKTDHTSWIKFVMENNSRVEHEAFLTLWLSRFVFPSHPLNGISKHLFPVAVCLARGIKIALGPALLASIYRDLTLLKEKILALSKLESFEDGNADKKLELTIWSPFYIVQVWAWERFTNLQPNPNLTDFEGPRLARWHNMNSLTLLNVRLALDSEGSFQWRPYTTAMGSLSYKIYGDKEKWVRVDVELNEELKCFARCLNACELVGIGCIELYCPHRVAMQFGIDQDLPSLVERSSKTQELAWKSFDKQIKNTVLYIPSRHLKPDVTERYSEWWKQSVHGGKDGSGSLNYLDIPGSSFKGKNFDHHPLYPLGFNSPDSDEEDNLTVKEFLIYNNKLKSVDHGIDDDGKSLPPTTHSLLSSTAESNDVKNVDAKIKLKENRFHNEPRSGKGSTAMKNTSKNNVDNLSLIDSSSFLKDKKGGTEGSFDIRSDGLELEARINKLRKEIDDLKAAKFARKKVCLDNNSTM